MSGLIISVPAKWEKFLKNLARDHEIDLGTIVSELCDWAFSDPESKEQFEAWLDETYPATGEAEEEARAEDEETVEDEEESEEAFEEESHEHRD
jgi:hypothetical protein